VKQRLEDAQTQVFVRLTIGAMWEAWRLVEDRFLKRPLGREYLPLLDREAANALDRLKRRFGKGRGLSTIRTTHAFHHPGIHEINAAFEKAVAESDGGLRSPNGLPTSMGTRATRRTKHRDSDCCWMNVRWQVMPSACSFVKSTVTGHLVRRPQIFLRGFFIFF
jgi:hypothetical protein